MLASSGASEGLNHETALELSIPFQDDNRSRLDVEPNATRGDLSCDNGMAVDVAELVDDVLAGRGADRPIDAEAAMCHCLDRIDCA